MVVFEKTEFWHVRFIFWGYLVRVVLLFNFSHPFLFWVLIEVNLIFFILVAAKKTYFKESLEKFIPLFLYFIVQSLASFIFVFLCAIEPLSLGALTYNFALTTTMFLKLGLFPFYFWVVEFCYFSDKIQVFLSLVVQKIPFLVFIFRASWNFCLILLFFSSFFSCLLLWGRASLVRLLVFSGIYTTLWVYFSLFQRFFFFFLLFFFYGGVTFLICRLVNFRSWELNRKALFFEFFLLVLFFVGLPPLRFFFFKLFSSAIFLDAAGMVLFFLRWVLAFGAIIGYIKFFFKFFYLPKLAGKQKNNFLVVYISSSFFFFFFF